MNEADGVILVTVPVSSVMCTPAQSAQPHHRKCFFCCRIPTVCSFHSLNVDDFQIQSQPL